MCYSIPNERYEFSMKVNDWLLGYWGIRILVKLKTWIK